MSVNNQEERIPQTLRSQNFIKFTLLTYNNFMIIAVGMVTMSWAGRSGFRIAAGMRDLSVLQNVQTNSGAHPTTYSFSTGIFPEGNLDEASSWPLISTWCRG